MTYDWNGYSHQTLYAMVHGELDVLSLGDVEFISASGAEDAGAHADAWNEFATRMGDFHERLERALAESRGSWDGTAADSMHSSVTPLGQWVENAHQAGVATKNSADNYTEAFSRAKTSMPEPVKVNTTANPAYTGISSSLSSLVGAQQDQEPQEARAQQAKAEAVAVMQSYETSAVSSRDSMGSFPTPPQITTAVHDTSTPVTPVDSSPHTPPVAPRRPDSDRSRNTSHVAQSGGSVNHTPNANRSDPGLVTPNQASTVTNAGPIAQNPIPADRPPTTPSPGGSWTTQPLIRPRVAHVPDDAKGPDNRQARGSAPRGAGTPDGPGARLNREPSPGQSPGRGASNGAAPLEEAEPMPARGGIASGARGGGTGVGGMMGGSGSRREDNEERRSPNYLQDTHDDFWDDTPPVAPDVIE